MDGIYIWAVGVLRSSSGVLDWNKEVLTQVDVKTKKMLIFFELSTKRPVSGAAFEAWTAYEYVCIMKRPD